MTEQAAQAAVGTDQATETTEQAQAPTEQETEAASTAPEGTGTASTQPTRGGGRGPRKVREGLVVSDKMDKTVVVLVEDRVKHALYGKVMRRTSRLKAHDEQNRCGVGDRVQIMETRPLSATKRWRVVEILEKAK
jgi:small subunit ribosomal protein S17